MIIIYLIICLFKRYFYNGTININNLNPNEILELLETCDELNIDELIEDLQNYLIVEKKEWIEQNLIYAYKISSHHQLFDLLHNYCNKLVIEKPLLVTVLEKDDLKLEETDIWDCVIKWGIERNEELAKDISEWKKEDFV